MNSYVVNLKEHSETDLLIVGGKASNLSRLANVAEINIPAGFCITTKAYKEVFHNNKALETLITELSTLNIDAVDRISQLGRDIRQVILNTRIPDKIVEEIQYNYEHFGVSDAYAVRSSATAEDLPSASFAGLHDTYLNISGLDSILKKISHCWASLYSDRAISYRIQNGFAHNEVLLAVIVQKMVRSDISGVMFTADPVSSNRKMVSIDATYGLGEALVSGLVNTDIYKVLDNRIIEKLISTKRTGIYTKEDGGTQEVELATSLVNKQVLTDQQIITLAQIGKSLETYFSAPQDIEWCISDHQIYIVQSRPITTLYPLPEVSKDEKSIYISSGHLQMMTDTIRPLGMFFFKSVIGNPPCQEIGGRLFLDLSGDLSTFFGRKITKFLLNELGDTLMTSAVMKAMQDKDLIRNLTKRKVKVFNLEKSSGPFAIMLNAFKAYKQNDPDIVKDIIMKEEEEIKKMAMTLQELSGDEVFEFIDQDHENRRIKIANPLNAGILTVGLLSARSFDKKIMKWLGEKNASDTIIMSIPNSITSETGLSLMDVTDVIRRYDAITDYLKNPSEKTFFEDIEKLEGGQKVSDVLREYLQEYGMRCSGDIDITRPRWIENPIELVPSIMSNLENFAVNASIEKYEQGKLISENRIQEIVEKVEKLPNGQSKAKKIRRTASLIRNYIGFREYPKFSYMKRYYIYKQAMLREGKKLLEKGYINELEDIYFLYFDELRGMVNGKPFDKKIISQRRISYKSYEKLIPPRVMTSDGEIIMGTYKTENLPDNSLPGIPVSSGVIEGRARIVTSLKDAYLSEGEILVTKFTDPSWTPTFVSIKGLITEVGGLSTHGAIIAREYGLPAIVSVKEATTLIKNGQLIRLNGTEGYVEIIDENY